MQREELEASWGRTRAHLEHAFAQLRATAVLGDEDPTVQQYREWLDHNELELALHALEELGETTPARKAFWEFLLRAAMEMNLCDHVVRYGEKLNGRGNL